MRQARKKTGLVIDPSPVEYNIHLRLWQILEQATHFSGFHVHVYSPEGRV